MKLPFALKLVDNRILVSWLNPEHLDMRFGFFSDSVNNLPSEERFSEITTLETLARKADEKAPPNLGLIFHCGRCGSTLLCQILKQHQHCLVIGEPTIIGQVLNESTIPDGKKQIVLAAIFNIYAKWAASMGKYVVVKTTSWHISRFQLLHRLLPQSPKIFLYREPYAVIDSFLRKPSSWLTRKYKTINENTRLESVAARAYLENTSEMVARAESDNLVLLDFQYLDNSLTQVLTHFALDTDSNTLQKMRQQKHYYAKSRSGVDLHKRYSDKESELQNDDLAISEAISAAVLSNYAKLTSRQNNLGAQKLLVNA